MGRQVNFFMNKDDLDKFLAYMRSQNDRLIKARPGENLGPIYVNKYEELNDFTYYIYNPSLKIAFDYYKRFFTAELKMIEKFPLKDREEMIKKAEERQKRIGHVIDYASEVIEFVVSKVIENETRIKEGRIYVELYDYDENGMKFKRSDTLESMYVKYAKYIKKHFKISANKYYYIGPGAYELYKNGWWMGDTKSRDERFRIHF